MSPQATHRPLLLVPEAAAPAYRRKPSRSAACRKTLGHLISKIFLFFTEVCEEREHPETPPCVFQAKRRCLGAVNAETAFESARSTEDAGYFGHFSAFFREKVSRAEPWRTHPLPIPWRALACRRPSRAEPWRDPHRPSSARVAIPGAPTASVTAAAPVSATAPSPAARAPTSSGSSSSRSPRGSQRGSRP